MDSDSSTKFIGSLTKFLQSLCNGYVEFQRGVELVGHIYLSIDTGEKVDYILHERVSKNDENSVTFVSNSFHALPHDKEKTPENKDNSSKFGAGSKSRRDSSDDDDIMIVDQSKRVPGSSNSGSIPVRGVKRGGSPSSSERHAQRMRGVGGPSSASNRGSSSFQQNNRQHSGASQSTSQQEGLNISDVKLEQISKDELMTLASQVGDGGSRPPHAASASHSHSPRSEGAMWIKQEAADDDDGGGNETGWSHGRDDSNSNSGSNLYPVMLHQNPAAYSGPAFPGFPGHGSGSQSATNPYADPLPGTSQDSSGLDPSGPEEPWRYPNDDWPEGTVEEYYQDIARLGIPVSKRHQLPLHLRVQLIQQSSTKSQRQLAYTFRISKTQVFAILKKKEKILEMYERAKTKKDSSSMNMMLF
ncbi:uncharacterized protein LOC143299761 isoform X8 [Babylonia areolata]|uniref:uncharacterized protein LOC143299761 isoform X8 n=1 Tax=Babylonia areolata TaxID=304850 RepID=UPI003FD5E53F